MLCCVSKRAVAGADRGSPYDQPSARAESTEKPGPELGPEEDVPAVLLPCAICARTFMPQSLEKHVKVCERAAVRKRKPFDSAKQRIQGTDLAEFLPKQERKRAYSDDRSGGKPKSSWKETHDDFLRTIRAARNEIVDPPTQRKCSPVVSTGAPTRANEQGTCPTCNRHFGIKAYDRHVAWCKERVNRAPVSPATNIAKERLEARMKYRAPALKNRRAANREKYSPGSATGLQSKVSPTFLAKPKETISMPNCNKSNESPVKKSVIVRRPSQLKESVSAPGPMKSRPADRISRPPEDDPESISTRLTHLVTRTTHFPVPPLKPMKGKTEEFRAENKRHSCEREEKCHKNDRVRDGAKHSARSQKGNIVSARSQGNPKVNDVTVNADIVDMIVQPCTIYKDDHLVTWKQISREKTSENRASRSYSSVNFDSQSHRNFCLSENTEIEAGRDKSGKRSKVSELALEKEDAVFAEHLNQTYLIRDLTHDYNDTGTDNEMQSSVKDSAETDFYSKPKDDCKIEDCPNIKRSPIIDNMSPKVGAGISRMKDYDKENKTVKSLDKSVTERLRNRSDTSESNEEHVLQRLYNQSEDPVKETAPSSFLSLENSMYETIDPTGASTPIEEIVQNQICTALSFPREKSIIFCNDFNVSTSSTLTVKREEKEEEQNINKEILREIGCQVNICDCSLKHLKRIKSSESWRRRCGTYIINKSSKLKYCDSNDSLVEKISCKGPNPLESKEVKQLNSDDAYIPHGLEERMDEIIENYINEDFSSDSDRSSKTNFKMTSSTDIVRHTQNSEPKMPLDNTKLLKSTKINEREIEDKIRRSMDFMRNSTNSLISAAEAVKYTNEKQSDLVEVETIEAISIKNRAVHLKTLPTITSRDAMILNEIGERSQENHTLTKVTRSQLINLDPPHTSDNNYFNRSSKLRTLPPVLHNRLIRRSGSCKDYDPFLLAEQQMNDLLSDTNESVMDSPSVAKNETSFPLSHSSAFVKYPSANPDKRSSLIAPPTEFDDLTSDFSSDSTETNSLSREVFLRDFKAGKDFPDSAGKVGEKKSANRPLGRRVIIDRSKALGGDIVEDRADRENKNIVHNSDRNRKTVGKSSPKVSRSIVNRSNSIRASSAPKATPDRKTSTNSNNNVTKKTSYADNEEPNANLNNRTHNYPSLSGSNLSLSSIVSSEVDIKRSNSVFDELMASFEDENGSFPASLRSLLRNDSISISSPIHDRRQRNGQISDEELSSPESCKRQDQNKLSADSAYSSLNRKYSNHGRSANDVAGRLKDDAPRSGRRESDGASLTKYKLSKFCHECGFQFPETAKFCCQCGIKRLAL